MSVRSDIFALNCIVKNMKEDMYKRIVESLQMTELGVSEQNRIYIF